MKKKAISIILVILFAVMAVISGCGRIRGFRHYNIGYVIYDEDGKPAFYRKSIFVEARGEKTKKYKIDKVTLDFYYGSENELTEYIDENKQTIGVAIYFCNPQDIDPIYKDTEFRVDDYKNIEGLIFVKYIKIEEYNTEEYKAKYNAILGPEYNHKETLTVPSSIIDPDYVDEYRGTRFCFIVTSIIYCKDTGNYGIGNINGDINILPIKYEFIKKDTVILENNINSYYDRHYTEISKMFL